MARNFNGSTQYIEVGAAVVSDAACTLSCCVFVVSATTDNRALQIYHATGTSVLYLDVLNASIDWGERIGYIKTSGTVTCERRRNTDAATGYHWIAGAIAAYASDPAMYVDGSTVTGVSAAGSGGTAAFNRTGCGSILYAGTRYYGAGRVAESAVWASALSTQDGVALSLGFSPLLVSPVALKAYWPLGGAFADDNRDVVGPYSMTAYGSPTSAEHPRTIYPCECQCC